jgi:hypothetical protein
MDMALLFRADAHFHRPNGLDCSDEEMSPDLRNGKNAQKSKALTFG